MECYRIVFLYVYSQIYMVGTSMFLNSCNVFISLMEVS